MFASPERATNEASSMKKEPFSSSASPSSPQTPFITGNNRIRVSENNCALYIDIMYLPCQLINASKSIIAPCMENTNIAKNIQRCVSLQPTEVTVANLDVPAANKQGFFHVVHNFSPVVVTAGSYKGTYGQIWLSDVTGQPIFFKIEFTDHSPVSYNKARVWASSYPAGRRVRIVNPIIRDGKSL